MEIVAMQHRPLSLMGVFRPRNDRSVDTLKWTASVAQIIGYTATGMGWLPWNIGFFLVGLLGWLMVGVFWRDKALILVHLVALVAMVGGVLTR
ncbi:DUF6552 family protein [uncultured Pelagimonas sp.]|uniref:DUF6552 family protein n=1 Tax=uncultured Pelagimonas sp. TaxID=1618102 RepID=UPI00262DAA53|nr:DUF6552 family protein [uncultured Pelagimonas sp.]